MRCERNANPDRVKEQLAGVLHVVIDSLQQTSLRPMTGDLRNIVCAGKMLRSRLILRLGAVTGIPYHTLARFAACVEMIHAASLLHDDVIDGSHLRRGAPTFWLEKGVPGAILLGDLLICRGITLVLEVGDSTAINRLVEVTGEICDAEVEQELMLRGKTPEWDRCVSIARRKTGALFAFAASVVAGPNEHLSMALTEAGYAIGTAYQLSDDILDVCGDPLSAGKTLGSDAGRSKPTTFSAHGVSDGNPAEYIDELCEKSSALLVAWPDVMDAWMLFLNEDIYPCIKKHLDHYPVGV